MNSNPRKQKAGRQERQNKTPVLIVHLDDGAGRPLCGLREPFPSEAHSLAIRAAPGDVCLTCEDVRNWKQKRSLPSPA